MALVKYNATLENKTNVVELWNINELGEQDGFDGDTKMYVTDLNDTTMITPVGELIGNKFTASVDLSGVVTGVNYDYDHPVYNHAYSIRSSSNVYMYGKLNIVAIP